MKSKFKVGDKVTHEQFGEGVVSIIYSELNFSYPIHVNFEKTTEAFTSDGREFKNNDIVLFKVKEIGYKITDFVYIVTDSDQKKRQVTGILTRQNEVIYAISCGTSECWKYGFELSSERDILLTTNN